MLVYSCREHDIEILREKNIEFKTLPLVPLRLRNPLSVLDFIIRLTIGTIKSGFLLLGFRPSVAVGFGTYVSGPILLLAALTGIKTIIHEQNVYPGKANRILAMFVDKIAINFSETRDYLKRLDRKSVV